MSQTCFQTSLRSWLVLALGLTMAAPLHAKAQVHSLNTTFARGNGQAGNMFDIKATVEIHVVSLDCHFDAGTPTIEVHTVPGGYSGHESNAGAWTLQGSGLANSPGLNLPTPLPFVLDITILAGQTMGFYVTGTGVPGINYTNGTAIIYSNSHLELYEGLGVQYPFGATYSPRTWNGTVYYTSAVGVTYCYGDGSGQFCPCLNIAGIEEGCANSSGVGATLVGGGSPGVRADNLSLTATGLVPGGAALLFAGTLEVNGGMGMLFGDGLRCAGNQVQRLGVQMPNSTGIANFGPQIASTAGFGAGETRTFQVWYQDPSGSPCGSGFNLTNGVKISFSP